MNLFSSLITLPNRYRQICARKFCKEELDAIESLECVKGDYSTYIKFNMKDDSKPKFIPVDINSSIYPGDTLNKEELLLLSYLGENGSNDIIHRIKKQHEL